MMMKKDGVKAVFLFVDCLSYAVYEYTSGDHNSNLEVVQTLFCLDGWVVGGVPLQSHFSASISLQHNFPVFISLLSLSLPSLHLPTMTLLCLQK